MVAMRVMHIWDMRMHVPHGLMFMAIGVRLVIHVRVGVRDRVVGMLVFVTLSQV